MAIQSIYLAGGCFWGTQKFFDQFAGVLGTQVGYANGPTENPRGGLCQQRPCRDRAHRF